MNELAGFASGIFEGMKEFGSNISIIVNSLLLLIVYVLGVGASSLAARMLNKKLFDFQISKSRSTYWIDMNMQKQGIAGYKRQF